MKKAARFGKSQTPYFAVAGLTITPVMESTGTQALLNAAEKGIGVAILPYLLAKETPGQRHAL